VSWAVDGQVRDLCGIADRLRAPPIYTIETFYNQAMRVTVGVSGGIAAYKAAEVVRALQRQALEVHVVDDRGGR